ncbi:MAG: single-stranded DNA-binding protein [Bacteroidales bacterium]|jgi:single-strand DNA-binding protein|nr:single-stranded DNA-binding protein [Bacteroidales bacterium]
MSVNKVILVGNVGSDPEIRHLDNNVSVARFRLATSESYTAKNGEKVESTEWHNIVLWRGLAKVAEQYIKKGSKLYVEGKITNRQYEQNGVIKYFTEIVGNNMVMLDSKSYNRSEDNTRPNFNDSVNISDPASETHNFSESEAEDDLPF